MRDFCKNSIMSYYGLKADVLGTLDYRRAIVDNYDNYVLRIKEQKTKPRPVNEDFGLYL